MLSSLLFWKRKLTPPPTFQPEDRLGLKTIPNINLDEVVPSKNLHVITRTTRLVLTISLYPKTKMSRRGRFETNPNRRKKYPRDFPRPLTLLPSRAPRTIKRTTTIDNNRTVVKEFEKGKHKFLQVSREEGSLKLKLVLVEMKSLYPAPSVPGIKKKKKKTTIKKDGIIDEAKKTENKLLRKRSSSMSSLLSYSLKMGVESDGNGVLEEDSGSKAKKLINGMDQGDEIVEERESWFVLSSSLPERPAATPAARHMLQREERFKFGEPPLQLVGLSGMRAVKT